MVVIIPKRKLLDRQEKAVTRFFWIFILVFVVVVACLSCFSYMCVCLCMCVYSSKELVKNSFSHIFG